MAALNDMFFKLLVVGESGVGKTCLLLRFVDDKFSDVHMATVGVDFKIKTITIGDRPVKLQIWDTAGQERFRTLTESYYRNSHGVILVYDVTNHESYEKIRSWAEQIEQYGDRNLCKLLVGNKTDKEHERTVTTQEGSSLAKSLGIEFLETSAKDTSNVEEAFTNLATQILKKYQSGALRVPSDDNGTVNVSGSQGSNKKGCCKS